MIDCGQGHFCVVCMCCGYSPIDGIIFYEVTYSRMKKHLGSHVNDATDLQAFCCRDGLKSFKCILCCMLSIVSVLSGSTVIKQFRPKERIHVVIHLI